MKSDEFYGSEYDEEVSLSQKSTSIKIIKSINLKKSVEVKDKIDSQSQQEIPRESMLQI